MGQWKRRLRVLISGDGCVFWCVVSGYRPHELRGREHARCEQLPHAARRLYGGAARAAAARHLPGVVRRLLSRVQRHLLERR